MAINISDLFSRKSTLILIALLIAAMVIAYKLYSEGLFRKTIPVEDIYQNNNELIITDTIMDDSLPLPSIEE